MNRQKNTSMYAHKFSDYSTNYNGIYGPNIIFIGSELEQETEYDWNQDWITDEDVEA